MRSSSALSGRSCPLPRRFTEASELTATTSDAPSRLRLLEIGDVPAMQQVEHAVGEHQRPRQARAIRVERMRGIGDLGRIARLGQRRVPATAPLSRNVS